MIHVVNPRTRSVVPFRTIREAEEFVRELGRELPDEIYLILRPVED